MEKADDEQAEC